jgi:uncharacterized protein YjbI with pentapeptide repeats
VPRIYPGLVPFRDDPADSAVFFGRERDRRALTQMILSERLVLVYGTSGVGKTSLMQAAVCGTLRERSQLPVVVRPAAFTGSIAAHTLETLQTEAARRGVRVTAPPEAKTLWAFLRSAVLQRPDGDAVRPVIVLDQFEELFGEASSVRHAEFFAELADIVRERMPAALEARYRSEVAQLPDGHPARRLALQSLYGMTAIHAGIVLLIREDRMAELQRLQASVPAIFSAMYRLLPLDEAGARAAIEGPAAVRAQEGSGFIYGEGAVDEMLAFLAARSRQDQPEPGINPALLQILCSYVDDVRARTKNPGILRAADLGGTAGMQGALDAHYRRALGTLPVFRLGPDTRRWRPSAENLLLVSRPRAAAARLIEVGMITRGGRRISVVEDVMHEEFGVPLADIQRLENARLCVADRRSGRTWYELAHDRLVEPAVREMRRRHRAQKLTALLLFSVTASMLALLSRLAAVQWNDLRGGLRIEQDPLERARLIVEARQSQGTIDLQGLRLAGLRLAAVVPPGTTLSDIDFRGADLSAAHFDRLHVSDSSFDDASMSGATLGGATFHEVDFVGSALDGTRAGKARFEKCNLSRTSWKGADLSGAAFTGCDLNDADFTDAKLADTTGFDGTAWWEARGWSDGAWRSLAGRWTQQKLAASSSYRERISDLRRRRLFSVSRYTRAALDNELAYRMAIDAGDLHGGGAAADDAVRNIVDRPLEQLLDRFVRAPLTVQRLRADIEDTRGYIRLLSGDLAGAESDFNQCLREWSRNPACNYHRSLAAAARGDRVTAERWLLRSRQLGYQPSFERMYRQVVTLPSPR